jgi:hypothetical protein
MTRKALCPYRSVILMNNSRGACGEAMAIYLIQTRQYFKHRAISFFFFKYQIYCNRRNAFSLFKARETTGRLIFGGNNSGISYYIKVSSKE